MSEIALSGDKMRKLSYKFTCKSDSLNTPCLVVFRDLLVFLGASNENVHSATTLPSFHSPAEPVHKIPLMESNIQCIFRKESGKESNVQPGKGLPCRSLVIIIFFQSGTFKVPCGLGVFSSWHFSGLSRSWLRRALMSSDQNIRHAVTPSKKQNINYTIFFPVQQTASCDLLIFNPRKDNSVAIAQRIVPFQINKSE